MFGYVVCYMCEYGFKTKHCWPSLVYMEERVWLGVRNLRLPVFYYYYHRNTETEIVVIYYVLFGQTWHSPSH